MKKRFLSALAVLMLLATAAIAGTTTHYSWTTPTVGASQNTWGSTLNTTISAIDTNLWTVAGGRSVAVNAPVASASNITLTNPISSTQNIAFSAGSLKLILPAMNASTSMVAGGVLRVTNVGSNTFGVYAADASTAVVTTLTAGQSVEITLTSGATSNGTFLVSGPFLASANLLPLGISTSAASPSVAADATTGLYTAGAAEVDVSVSGTQKAKWTTSGYNLPYTTASQLLSTDASKNLVSTTTLPNGTTATTQAANDNSTKVATTAYTNSYAPLASPTLTGTPTAPTAALNTTSTQVATTAFANPAASVADPGYVKLPSGIIIEWGHVTGLSLSTGSTYTVTYPLAMSSATYSAQVTIDTGTPDDGTNAPQSQSFSTTGFVFKYIDAGGTVLNSFSWIAIGS